ALWTGAIVNPLAAEFALLRRGEDLFSAHRTWHALPRLHVFRFVGQKDAHAGRSEVLSVARRVDVGRAGIGRHEVEDGDFRAPFVAYSQAVPDPLVDVEMALGDGIEARGIALHFAAQHR